MRLASRSCANPARGVTSRGPARSFRFSTRASAMPSTRGTVDAAPAGAEARRRTFALFDASRREELIAAGRDVRVVHMVRHAQGTHNVDARYRDPKNLDARLTPFGEQQCEALAAASADVVAGATLVVTSPLTRCVQTAVLSFPALASRPPAACPFLAHESVRETVNFACDRRRDISVVAAEFPRVDFAHCPEERDGAWAEYEAALPPDHDDHRESADLARVADRGRAFFAWLETRAETEVAVSSHSAFLRCLFSWGLEGGVRAAPEQTLAGAMSGASFAAADAETPVAAYDDDEFEAKMRRDWENCELRTFLVAY